MTERDTIARAAVDVIIPVYRPGSWLQACLASVGASVGVETRVVVVDNSEPDDPPVQRPALVGLRWIRPGRNLGFAAATNLGIRLGNAPAVLCLNQDARVAPDFLARLAPLLLGDPTVGSVCGKVLRVSGPIDAPDGLIDTAGLQMSTGRRAIDIGQGARDDGDFDGSREVFGVSAAVALYRRAALEAVTESGQVFDERFFMYKEDVDLAWRLRRGGYRAIVDGSAVAYHGRSVARQDFLPGRFGSIRALIQQERGKPAWARRLAWRNQWLMVVKNERGADVARSALDYVVRELSLLGLGLMIDPVGTVGVRVKLLGELAEALRRRRKAQELALADISDWLP